jgi:putative ABC transport system permease protein
MHDLRYAIRQLVRHPGFTLVSVLALGLGIGANTAIFSVVNAALLRPLPYRDSSRLVVVWDQLVKLGLDRFPVSYANYLDYRAQNTVFQDVAAFANVEFNLTAGDQAERVPGIRVSANLLPMLGATPAAGRIFTSEENGPGRGNVVVVSDSLWQRRFGRDRSIVGKTIMLDGNALTVVGILPANFSFSAGNPAPELWVPVELRPDPDRTAGALELIARLKSGVTLAQASDGLRAVARGIEDRYHPYRGPHGEDAGYRVTAIPLREELYGSMRRGLLVLLGAVAFVLLIACANVASLLLARTAVRRREIAVRLSLGAGRFRLVRQLLVESITLSAAGGLLGSALAFWGVNALRAMMPDSLVHLENIPLDLRVLAFALALSLITGVIFGLAPALEGSGLTLSETLKAAGRGVTGGASSRRIRRVLITAEVALSLVLVIGAGLLIKSFARLLSVHPGFRAERMITARISLSEQTYQDDRRVAALYAELLERVRMLPGVLSASVVSQLPLTGGSGGDPFSIEGRPYDTHSRTPQITDHQVIGPDYFRTMQIPLLAGRIFRDREPEPAVIINQTMARGFWPGDLSQAIGRRILLGAPRPGTPWLTIAGVVGDVRNSGLAAEPIPQMYVPIDQTPAHSMALVVRTARDSGSLISAVRAQLFSIDPNQPLYDVKTMDQRVAATVAQPRFQTVLLGTFGALALILAAIGIYGVIAQSVVDRTHEIGIRMALGAPSGSVLRSVIWEGLVMGLAGTGLGLAATLPLAHLLASLLYEVPALDAGTFLSASLLLLMVVLAASYIPARRAAKLDPVAALRWE